MAGPVGGLRKHPHGRVDQLEDRYLGMVEAPSSNLGTSTSLKSIDINEVDCAATNLQHSIPIKFIGSARPLLFKSRESKKRVASDSTHCKPFQ